MRGGAQFVLVRVQFSSSFLAPPARHGSYQVSLLISLFGVWWLHSNDAMFRPWCNCARESAALSKLHAGSSTVAMMRTGQCATRSGPGAPTSTVAAAVLANSALASHAHHLLRRAPQRSAVVPSAEESSSS
jgi:hypothetical protein